MRLPTRQDGVENRDKVYFAIQITLTQYSGRSKHEWASSETVKKKNPKSTIRLAVSHF